MLGTRLGLSRASNPLLRRTVFLVAAVSLAIAAAPLGVLVTGADLSDAFLYVIAIERLVDADVAIPTGLLLLGGYALSTARMILDGSRRREVRLFMPSWGSVTGTVFPAVLNSRFLLPASGRRR